ncbi:MAG: WYL domain-containing protein [Eubacteriaceae bacterium]|jgi:predicted DNA-binding transcriptional regulator YafY|nr:WYL domain-containing protein [Eubacteriaceae bacterium]
MTKTHNRKLKLLYLSQIFHEKTDENHGLTMKEIISYLSDYNIRADRKTLYLDFDELRHYGMDILSEQVGRTHIYKLVSRDFELPELKLLVDAVQSSKFITETKSRNLIQKLSTLVSMHEAKQLQRQVLIRGRVKTMNESIYYNVDKLHTAIIQDKQIKFKYFQWTVDKEQEYRHNGAWYHISPWHLCWDDENYYLIGYDAESEKLKHYRVDKMKKMTISDTPRDNPAHIEDFDPTVYTKGLFGMFGGETCRVTLEGENHMVGVLIDRFGKDIPIVKLDDNRFYTHIEVAVSPQFLGWIASMAGALTITAPETVVERMKNLAKKLNESY